MVVLRKIYKPFLIDYSKGMDLKNTISGCKTR